MNKPATFTFGVLRLLFRNSAGKYAGSSDGLVRRDAGLVAKEFREDEL